MKTHAPAPPTNLVWPDEELKVPDEFSGPAWEIVEENYSSFPFVMEDGSVVWLHSGGRRAYNAFQQKNWSKAWTTDARADGNAVDVGKLTSWLYSFIEDGNRTKTTSISNGNFVEQGPYEQNNAFPGFTPYQLCHKASCEGPYIEMKQPTCIG